MRIALAFQCYFPIYRFNTSMYASLTEFTVQVTDVIGNSSLKPLRK